MRMKGRKCLKRTVQELAAEYRALKGTQEFEKYREIGLMAKMHLDRHGGPSKKSMFPSSLLDECQNVGDIVSAKTNLPEQLPDLQALQLVKFRHRQEKISNEKQEAQDTTTICQASSQCSAA